MRDREKDREMGMEEKVKTWRERVSEESEREGEAETES